MTLPKKQHIWCTALLAAGVLVTASCGEDDPQATNNVNNINNVNNVNSTNSTNNTNNTNSTNNTNNVNNTNNLNFLTGRFVDSAVEGLTYTTPSTSGKTDTSGVFEYLDGELVTFSVGTLDLGTTHGRDLLSPLHLPGESQHKQGVYATNISMLLQSLDADADPSNGILITPDAEACLDAEMASSGAPDLSDTDAMVAFVDGIVDECSSSTVVTLQAVAPADAEAHLYASLEAEGEYFIRNLAQQPDKLTEKTRLEMLGAYTTGKTTDGTPTGEDVLPLVAFYVEEVGDTGASDVHTAISLDWGDTWTVYNLSMAAHLSSYMMPDGSMYPGSASKAVVKTKGRFIFVTWTSKYCPDAAPGDLTEEQDIYGVNGVQSAVDYAAMGYTEVGVIPYSCMWTTRGIVKPNGDIQFAMPEQLTGGTRDAIQNFAAVGPSAGFAVAWQEDPEGLKPGGAEGPGHGWSGAVVNKQTDIWYSFVQWSEFFALDMSYDAGADSWNPGDRVKLLNPMSSPVRVSDNSGCKFSDVQSGTYGSPNSGNPDPNKGTEFITYAYCADHCVSQDEDGFCVDAEGRVLRGNTGASRANLFLIPQKNAEGVVTGAEVIFGYEESKGLGESSLEEGKYIRFHHFADFSNPNVIDEGHIFNQPNDEGVYENARRIRFVQQPEWSWGESQMSIIALYRQGLEGQGRPADVFVRFAYGGNDITNFEAPINVSSQDLYVDPVTGDYSWSWSESNHDDQSDDNPFDDSRAHRAQIRGDFVALGYTWTPNWAGASIGADHYDFYIRRSFDGGRTFTNAAGEVEGPVNVSNLPDHSYSVIEPRIVATPGTIKNPDGTPTGNPEDKQDVNTFFMAYGTATNSPFVHEEVAVPEDLFYARSTDKGETWETMVYDPTGNTYETFPPLATSALEEGECQLRMTPAGNRLFVTWNADGETSDPMFRAIDYTPAP